MDVGARQTGKWVLEPFTQEWSALGAGHLAYQHTGRRVRKVGHDGALDGESR
jgi:hypothetical protein